ncbi:MAG: FAD-dependent monooxygenase [Gammaproteobacteria bacterium]|nr:FAD-dependent monooxygenase [Gammaproteobacteria bacterium]
MQKVIILGAGLAGALLAVLLARRGYAPLVIERRPDPRASSEQAGRSINLALSDRGIVALQEAGVFARIEPLLIPMRGRQLHEADISPRFMSYGQRDEERIHSVSRRLLNRVLVDSAAANPAVKFLFDHRCVHLDPLDASITLVDEASGETRRESADVIIGCDGAGSRLRQCLVDAGLCEVSEEWLPHGYRELTLPAAADGRHALRADALHIWPRGGHMLIALPNLDGTFTCTLFLPHEGDPGFDRLGDADSVHGFFSQEFPDTVPLMPALAEEFLANPVGHMATVRCQPWHFRNRVLLLGDAAHAIVPFHGQGMNCAFEDCRELDSLIGTHGSDWEKVFAEFQTVRLPSANAIADMALENYVEMRDTVRDPRFALKKALAFELERVFPEHFIPRYSMVMFHPEISYAEAQRRGRIQDEVLESLTRGVERLEQVDRQQAHALVRARLAA